MQDEALYKCRLLLFNNPALEAQPKHVVPKGYVSLGGILGGVSTPSPLRPNTLEKVRAAQMLPLGRGRGGGESPRFLLC